MEKRNTAGKRVAKKRKGTNPLVVILRVFGTLLLSVLMIVIITGSIFATALTIYVLNFADTTTTVNLEERTVSSSVTRIFYKNPKYDPEMPNNKTDEWTLYYGIKSQQRKPKWVDIDKVPTYTQDAFVYTEDQRFYTHDGVDFRRTLASIVKTLLGDKQGGSTITQQAIKNVTDDNETEGPEAIERKLREIFRAINVEKVYTKQDILQAYLNVIEFGDGYNEIIGLQSAANYYFRKDASDLTLAESASLAAMIKSPTTLNPLYNKKENRDRMDYTFKWMLENGAISNDEYDEGLKEADNLVVYGDPDFSSSEEENEFDEDDFGVTDWFLDAAIDQAIWSIANQYGIEFLDAEQRFYSGGYDVYTTVDINMQKEMTERMRNNANFQTWSFDKDQLQSGFVVVDYNGRVLCNVSSRRKKKESRIFNLVHQGERSPGSCIKPIASYAPALDQDLITYSSMINDSPINVDADSDGVAEKWPVNYSEDGLSENWSYNNLTTWQMIMKSLNTAPAQLVQQMTPNYCYNFLREKLDVTTLREGYDNDYSGMTVGGLYRGMHLEELAGAYTIFGNGGKKYETTYLSKVVTTDGTVIYEQSDGYKQAIADSTAYIMNQMMRKVVTEADGTGRYAKLKNTVLAAKTGTSSNWVDLNFVGCTPDYVSAVWIGYEEWKKIPTDQYQNIGEIWHNLFSDYCENEKHHDFTMPESVTELRYCTSSGDIANAGCPSAVGYYKKTNIPAYCSWH
ncbi:MAG: transglycosylase domain-containing protein [Ruminococcus sp.]|nr:transglycosylase domain-containing protein [Ruminococcus sp.]